MLSKNKAAPRLDNLPQGFGMDWQTRTSFELQGYHFDIPNSMKEFLTPTEPSHPDSFYLGKTTPMIGAYLRQLRERMPSRILELGVYQGGSAAFLQLLAKPQRMLAMDLSTDRLPLLENFIEKEKLTKRMHMKYGIDQADKETVRGLVAEHLGEGRSVDLVVDDASHLLAPTRASFEAVFPYVRSGGSFVIEDYASLQIVCNGHLDRALDGEQGPATLVKHALRDGLQDDLRPLHAMAVEVMLASILEPTIFAKVIVDRHWLRIVRGSKHIEEPENFRLADYVNDYFGLLNVEHADNLKSYLPDV